MPAPLLRNTLLAFVVCLVVGILALLTSSGSWLLPPRKMRSSGKIGCLFLGITNEPTAGPSALVALTNQNDWDLAFILYPAQVESDGAWPAIGSPPLAVSLLPMGGRPAVLSVPVPTNGSIWRVPLCWTRVPSKYDLRVSLWALSTLLRHGPATPSNPMVLPEKYRYPAQTNFVMEVQM